MSKKQKRQEPKRHKAAKPSLPQQSLLELPKAHALIKNKRWTEARAVLEALNARYPHRVDVLEPLVTVYSELRDHQTLLATCRQVASLAPNDGDFLLALGGAYMINRRPLLALQTLRHLLERWPDHAQAADVRQSITDLEGMMSQVLTDVGLTGEDGPELAAWHEEAQCLMVEGRYPQSRQIEEQILRRQPDFAPALNNISQTYAVEGQLGEAIAAAERVLAFAPENFHALSNLTRYLCFSGRLAEAKQYAERLKAVQSSSVDVWVKKAEALSFLGDDEGVLAAFRGAEEAGHLKPPLGDPLLYHLAAVAALRLGREDVARQRWQQALKISPGFEVAQANLDDLRKPVGERHAPWPYALPNWFLQKSVSELAAMLKSMPKSAGSQTLQRYLSQHPEFPVLMALLLDRGDPQGREFALRTARWAKTPEMLVALRTFALSQRGPDKMRMQAAETASEAGLLSARAVRMWMQGEWHEVFLMGFELHGEPPIKHRPQVQKWLMEAVQALQERKGDDAQRLLKQALEVEPDAPDVRHNLAGSYELLGDRAKAEAITREVLEQHPDYVFARTSLARLALTRGQIDEAQALLEPLYTRKKLHFEEYAAFSNVHLELCLAQGKPDGARSWLDMWAGLEPDHPVVAEWQQRLGKKGVRERILRR